MEIKVGTNLTCGCCGIHFVTWEGYEDQDQDYGWGICQDCQSDIEDRNEAEYDKLIKVIAEGMSGGRGEEFLKWDRDRQKSFCLQCLDKGYITYSFGKA